MKKQNALIALDRLEDLINSFGAPYAEDHREFKSLVAALRSGPLQDSYYRGKLFDLDCQATAGFSIRKFSNKSGELAKIKAWALGSLTIARDLVNERWPI